MTNSEIDDNRLSDSESKREYIQLIERPQPLYGEDYLYFWMFVEIPIFFIMTALLFLMLFLDFKLISTSPFLYICMFIFLFHQIIAWLITGFVLYTLFVILSIFEEKIKSYKVLAAWNEVEGLLELCILIFSFSWGVKFVFANFSDMQEIMVQIYIVCMVIMSILLIIKRVAWLFTSLEPKNRRKMQVPETAEEKEFFRLRRDVEEKIDIIKENAVSVKSDVSILIN